MTCVIDPRGLLPGVQWETRERFLELGRRFCRATGDQYVMRVRSGRRTCAEQRQIYQQGRSTAGMVVTHADGCQSWHVMGRAIDSDIILASSGAMAPEAPYTAAGALWRGLGGRWGGDFPGFPDIGHFEFHPGLSISGECPVPSACSDAAVDTVGPGALSWAIASAAVVGTAAWLFWPELEAAVRRLRLA